MDCFFLPPLPSPYPLKEKVVHFLLFISNLPKHLFSTCAALLCQLHSKLSEIQCMPQILSWNNLLRSLWWPFQAKAEDQHCPLIPLSFSTPFDFRSSSSPLLLPMTGVFLPLSQLLWRILLLLHLAGDFHKLVALLLSSAITTANPA